MDPLWAGATPSGPRRPLLGLGNPFWAWEIPSGVARAQKSHVSPEGVARAQTGLHSPAKHPLMAKNLLSEYLPSDHSNHFTHQASRELRKRKKPVCEAGQWPRHTMVACIIQNPKLSVLITCLVEGAIQGVTNSGNVKSALGLAKSRLGYNM